MFYCQKCPRMGFFGDPIWEFLSQRLEIFSKFGDFYWEFFEIWGFLSPWFLSLGIGYFLKCGDFYPNDWGSLEIFFAKSRGYLRNPRDVYLRKIPYQNPKRCPITGIGIGDFHLSNSEILIIIKKNWRFFETGFQKNWGFLKFFIE